MLDDNFGETVNSEAFNVNNTRLILDFWLSSKKNRETRRAYEYDIKCFIAFLLKDSPESVRLNDINLRTITVDNVQAFAKFLEIRNNPKTGKPLAITSRTKRLKSVKSFLSYGCEVKYLTFNAAEEFLNQAT